MNYTRTASRIVTNTLPAWVSAIASANTLYEVGTLPSTLTSSIVWPGGSSLPGMVSAEGVEGMHRGWGSCVFAEDVGPFGAMVYMVGGENTIPNRLHHIPLSNASPDYAWWQQPVACLTLAEAIARDSDVYYNVADYNAILGTNREMPAIGTTTWDTWYTTWAALPDVSKYPTTMDGTRFAGWVMRRKFTNGFTMGDLVGTNWRYNAHAFVPASWTGAAAGSIVINQKVFSGPYNGSAVPFGSAINPATNSHFAAAVYSGSGNAKRYLMAQNTATRAWTNIAEIPDYSGYSSILDNHCMVDSTRKQLHYFIHAVGNFATWTADFSAGIGAVTTSGPTAVSYAADWEWASESGSAFTDGHPTGKRLFFFWCADASNNFRMGVYDKDTNVATLLNPSSMTGLTLQNPTRTGIIAGGDYDPVTNELIWFEHTDFGTPAIWVHRAAVPTSYTSAAAWTWTSAALTPASGVTVQSSGPGASVRMYGQRCHRLRTIPGGRYYILPMATNKPLAFKLS